VDKIVEPGKHRLLIISNNLDSFKTFQNLTEADDQDSMDCQCVSSVGKAVHEISISPYDLIIIDAENEGEFIRLIRKIFKIKPHIPVIGLVPADFKHASGLMEAGFFDVWNMPILDKPFVKQKIISFIERGKMEKMIHTRDEILEAVNLAAETFLLNSNWENSIDSVLGRLGQATHSDRVYVFINGETTSTGLSVSICAEWAGDGIRSISEIMSTSNNTYESIGLGRWQENLSSGKVIHGMIEEMPKQEKQTFAQINVKSLVAAPIFVDQIWWGFIGFDQCRVAQGWTHVQIDAIRTAANILGAALSHQVAEKRLTFLASHDFLTSLPNRMLFEDRFLQAAVHADRNSDKVAVISLDLDKFKSVNDTYGHPVGDQVLMEVGRRLTHTLRESDTCARIGGDEFGIIAETIHNKADVIKVMEKLTRSFENPVIVDGKSIDISASMGAAIYPNNGKDLESIMKSADLALYDIKGKQLHFKVYEDIQFPLPENLSS
jgi:diguanylate cyclase (GGDEF)-like protein